MTKHMQATIRKIIVIMITSIVLFSLLPTNIILAENSKTSANLNDYSELLVDVMQDSEIVYSGKLGGFANGVYANVNFEKLDLLCVYQLSEDKTFTIIPRKNQANTNDINNTSVITNDNNIVSVCFQNNNRYAENKLTQGLIYEVTFQNKLSSAKKFMPFFVVYSKDGMLKKIYKGGKTTQTTPAFTDVPQTHWGYGAAENAYALGIINGVGNNQFAPDKTVTATEFATMLLRSAKEQNFDWTQAINILIDKGILTEEETKTMDFFTRGDMAKIIYETQQRGLLR